MCFPWHPRELLDSVNVFAQAGLFVRLLAQTVDTCARRTQAETLLAYPCKDLVMGMDELADDSDITGLRAFFALRNLVFDLGAFL